MSLLGGLPHKKSQAFRGKLFANDQLIASMVPGHCVTFRFDPATVSLTAQTWVASGPTGGPHITQTLAPGKHYFVELRTKESWPLGKMFGIEEITWDQARIQHVHDEPLDKSHVEADGNATVIIETSFPSCT